MRNLSQILRSYIRRAKPPPRRPIASCRQVVVSRFGGSEVLELRNVELPPIDESDILIRTRAVSINPIDILTHYGVPCRRPLPSPPFVLGFDVSGQVLEVGSNVESIRVGENVFGFQDGIEYGGTYSEYLKLGSISFTRKPDCITHEAASAIPYAAMTARAALLDTAMISGGQRVLIIGGDEAIGYLAIQLAVDRRCHVVTTCRGQNIGIVMAAGANQAIDYLSEDIQLAVKGKFDVVLDTIGGARIEKIGPGLVKRGGHYITLMENEPLVGPEDKLYPFRKMDWITYLRKNHGIAYTILSWPPDRDSLVRISKLARTGRLRIPVAKTFPITQVREAFEAAENLQTIGKVVLTFD